MIMEIGDKHYDTSRFRVQAHSRSMNLIFDCEAQDIYEGHHDFESVHKRSFKQQMDLISLLNYDQYLYMKEIKWFHLGEPSPESPEWY